MNDFKLRAPADQLNYINYVNNKFVTTYILRNKSMVFCSVPECSILSCFQRFNQPLNTTIVPCILMVRYEKACLILSEFIPRPTPTLKSKNVSAI